MKDGLMKILEQLTCIKLHQPIVSAVQGAEDPKEDSLADFSVILKIK